MILFMIILTLSTVVYYYVQNTIQKNTYEANKQVLFQMEYNISQMDDSLKKITLNAYNSVDVMSIMNNNNITEKDYLDISQKLDVLQKNILNFNPFIHSIYIYNNFNKRYFGTYMGMLTPDKTLENTLSNYKTVPKIMPIARKFDTGEYEKHKLEDVFTYTMYESTDSNNVLNGAVFVNVKSQWVIDNIKTIGSVSDDKSDGIFILTDHGEVISHGNSNAYVKKWLKDAYRGYTDNYISKGETFGFSTNKIGKEKYFTTFLYIKQANWIILKVQPEKQVFKNVYRLRNMIICITLIFIIFAAFLSLNISKKIYRPVDNLIKEVLATFKKGTDKENIKDEIKFLEEIFKQSIEAISSEVEDRNSNILNTYFLRNLLVDSSTMMSKEFEQAINNVNLPINLNRPMVVCVLKIDKLNKFNEEYREEDRDLYKYAILNVASEIVGKLFENVAIDTKSDHVAMIVNTEGAGSDFYREIIDMFEEIQMFIQKVFRFSISTAVSEMSDNGLEISKNYKLALNYSEYRYIYGEGCIITKDMIQENLSNNQFDYSYLQEKKLIEAIKDGNLTSAEKITESIFNEIRRQSYNNILLSSAKLVNTVKNTLIEYNKSKLQQLEFDFTILNNNILEFETIDELRTELFRLLKYGMETDKVEINEKHKILIDAIKDIVNANYSDSSFCAAVVADMLKVSLNHISKVFKNNTEISLVDYINEVRMKKAAELLESLDISVNQVMTRVGIDNESNFYRNFKKKFGTTPKEYVLNIQLSKTNKILKV